MPISNNKRDLLVKLTFEISRACHRRCAVLSSSSLKPITLALALAVAETRALRRLTKGDFNKPPPPGVRESCTERPDIEYWSRSFVACLSALFGNTTSNDRLSLKYSSRLRGKLLDHGSRDEIPKTHATSRNKKVLSLKLMIWLYFLQTIFS